MEATSIAVNHSQQLTMASETVDLTYWPLSPPIHEAVNIEHIAQYLLLPRKFLVAVSTVPYYWITGIISNTVPHLYYIMAGTIS